MAYDDSAETELLATIDDSTEDVETALDALTALRPLLLPDTSTRASLFLSSQFDYYPKPQKRDEIDAAFAAVRALDASIQAFTDILTARNNVTESRTQPYEATLVGGDPWTLVKDWNFGTLGNITNTADLDAEFDYVSLFGTYNNGGAYGTNTVATSEATAVPGQPVDPSGHRYREFTPNSILCHVRSLVDDDTPVGPAAEHNGGNGSIFSKFKYDFGGSELGLDICWETRFRIKTPRQGQWFALWTVGSIWDLGPEMDVIEAFSAWDPYYLTSWHSDPVGGTADINYWPNWYDGQIAAGYPMDADQNSLERWHTITWVYKADDSYEVWMDGVEIQSGDIEWIVPSGPSTGTPVNMQFLFDMGALHTQVGDYVNLIIPADQLPITTEIDYSRVWQRTPPP